MDDPAEEFRKAERHLRGVLLGDGSSRPGVVKGEEARAQLTRILVRMRDAFETSLREGARAEARAAGLEEELAGLEEELREVDKELREVDAELLRIAASKSGDRSRALKRKAS
jgi:hypothetical protein